MLSQNTLLSRRKFLALIPSLPMILSGHKKLVHRPKFQIGDYVECRWSDEEVGTEVFERGSIVGILVPENEEDRKTEWNYQFQIEDCSSSPQFIGGIGCSYESELTLLRRV